MQTASTASLVMLILSFPPAMTQGRASQTDENEVHPQKPGMRYQRLVQTPAQPIPQLNESVNANGHESHLRLFEDSEPYKDIPFFFNNYKVNTGTLVFTYK